jgi:hypothetical protein
MRTRRPAANSAARAMPALWWAQTRLQLRRRRLLGWMGAARCSAARADPIAMADIRYCFLCGAEGHCPHREDGLLSAADRRKLAAELEAKLTTYSQRPAEPTRDLTAEEARLKVHRAASAKVGWAVRRGVLIRPARCQDCGRRCFPDAHHEDYSKPLEVEWLCRKCHRFRDTTGRPRRLWENSG